MIWMGSDKTDFAIAKMRTLFWVQHLAEVDSKIMNIFFPKAIATEYL